MRKSLLIGCSTCVLIMLASASASVAAAAPARLTVVSPRARAVFTARRAVSIQVRVPPRSGRLTASVGTRAVTRRFGPARRGVRTARLVVGRDLQPGTNLVTIRAGRTRASLQIVAGTRQRALVRVQRFLRTRHGKQCLCVRATFQGGLGNARRPLVGFEASLNGRNVTNQFWLRQPRQRAALLGAQMGLHYGRNTLTVLVFDNAGDYERRTTSIVVPRTLPLAAAGFDQRVRLRQRVRLNGTGSVSTRRGGHLRYRWRIVSAPRGSRARLRGAGSARPVLVPDVRGNYRVRLTVAGMRGRAARRGHVATAAVADAAPTPPTPATTTTTTTSPPAFMPLSNGDPLSGATSQQPPALVTPTAQVPTQQNSAVVTIAASALIQPMGCAVNTNPAPGWGTTIDGTGCPTLPPKGSAIRSQGGVQLVVLDRGTLAVDENAFFPATGSTNWQQLSDDVAGTYSSQIVMLSGVDLPASFSQSAINSLNYVLGRIGATGGLTASMPALRSGAWSAIGWIGLNPGSANQDFAQNAGASGDTGNLSGYLQIDTNANYVFVHSDYIPFNTSATSTATSNAVQVGSQTVPSRPLPAGDSGFQVLAFNAYAFAGPTLSQTFITNTPQGRFGPGIQQMAAALGQAAANPWLVIVQSIGQPAVSPAWVSQLTPQITRVGANWNVFNGLNGKGGYALVGGAGAGAAPVEQSGPLTGVPGQLSGILARNTNNRLVVTQDAVSANVVTNLMPLAFSPGQPWPVPAGVTPAAAQAANHYIAQQLFNGQWPDVRDAYWNDSTGGFGSNLLFQLTNEIHYPAGGSPAFSGQDFTAVQAELAKEFGMVSAVRKLIAGWQQVFAVNGAANIVNLQNVAQSVQDAVDPPSNGGVGFDPMQLVGVLTEAASVAGEAGDVPGLGALASIYRLAGSIATITTASGDVPVTQQINTTADQMGWQLSTTYAVIQKSLSHVADLLVSNYGRLATAAQHANSDWALSTSIEDKVGVYLSRAATQMAYGAMVPLAYPTVYDLRSTGLNPSGTSAQQYRCFAPAGFGGGIKTPFRYTPAASTFMGVAGIDGNGNYLVDANVLSKTPSDAWLYNGSGQIATGLAPPIFPMPVPPASLLEPMFQPVSEGGNVGLFPQYFFAQHFTQRPVACTSTGR